MATNTSTADGDLTTGDQGAERVAHTPGPWAVHTTRAVVVPADQLTRPLGAHMDQEIDRAKYAQEICALHWPDRNRSESEVYANARLIAAAPELLAALEDWVAYAEENLIQFDNPGECDQGDNLCPMCRSSGCIQNKISRARAAIAKAEGRS